MTQLGGTVQSKKSESLRSVQLESVTCEDRNYECCDLMPLAGPWTGDGSGDFTADEYDAWYEPHVLAYERRKA